ncbi:MAG: divalent-cation tolerance protein CutA [Bacillota bacterium]|nr:divalent-cation tolerance protein CutA [Bacillota bacterium]
MSVRYCLVYVTAGSSEEAVGLGEAAVSARLAACANVVPGVTSVYRWEGNLEHASEAVLVLKTRMDLVPALRDEIKSRHSYQVPAFLVVPLDQVEASYASWMDGELRSS